MQLFGAGAFLRHLFTYNRTAQKVLLGLTLLMTAMVLGDGVLTPSISGTASSLVPGAQAWDLVCIGLDMPTACSARNSADLALPGNT